MDRTSVFQRQRARLNGIAYRMLGSADDAEDILQDAYLRWHRADPERLQSPEAWLVTTVTRLCIDRLRSARVEREVYVGPWLPEPIVTVAPPSPDAHVELASDLSTALLVLLERLAPEERAAFLLHDVFDTEYHEISLILGKNEAACRQVVHRARERVRTDRPRFEVSETARTRVLDQFLTALQTEDQAALVSLLAEDVTWTADGGGKVRAALKSVHGSKLVSRFALGIWRRYLAATTFRRMTINGEAALVAFKDDRPFSVFTIATDGLRIFSVFAVVNPDKLKHIPAP